MLRSLSVTTAVLTLVLLSQPETAKAQGVVGKRWEYTVTKDGETVDSGTFRAHEFTIYKGGAKQGTYRQPAKDHVILTIDKGKLKGTVDLRQTRDGKKPIWRGAYKNADGESFRIMVKFLDD